MPEEEGKGAGDLCSEVRGPFMSSRSLTCQDHQCYLRKVQYDFTEADWFGIFKHYTNILPKILDGNSKRMNKESQLN